MEPLKDEKIVFIFAENYNNKKTTKDLFWDCLHKYIITDAIKDDNVLVFYVKKIL